MYGGFHLIDGSDFVEVESTDELINIAHELINLLPMSQFYTVTAQARKPLKF